MTANQKTDSEVMATAADKQSMAKKTAAKVKPGEELVTVHLFKDADKYADDVTIGVNGKIVKVQRGVDVKLKKKYALVLERSIRQDRATADLINAQTSAFAAEAKRYNI